MSEGFLGEGEGDDFFSAAPAAQEQSEQSNPMQSQLDSSSEAQDAFFGASGAPAETTEESSAEVSQPDENDIFGAPAATQQSPEGDLFGAPPEAQQVESKAADVPEQATANGLMADTAMSASAGPQQQQQQQQHSSGPLEKWRQERDEKLRALKEQEEEEKERLHQEARKEREQMWEKRNKEIEARHKTNINNEQTTVYDGTGNSNVWEGVLDLVDLQGDDSGSESKMRNLLLRLKRL